MNLKNYLSQYRYLLIEVEELEHELKFDQDEEVERILKKRLNDCKIQRQNIEKFISSVDDSKIRVVLHYRYIKGLTWQQIAFKIDETNECYPRRDIHDKFIRVEGSKIMNKIIDKNAESVMI